MKKLYRIKTTGQMTALTPCGEENTEVCVYWFRDKRDTPAFSYSEAIPGWDDMLSSPDQSKRNPEYADRLQAYVDQLFTREEVDTIKGYFLTANTLETVIEEIELPVTDFDTPFRAIPPAPEGGDGYGFIELYGTDGYPLPFKVCGFFDVVYESPYERYQMAKVKSLLERSGLSGPSDTDFRIEVKEISEKLKHLRSALVDLQRSLNGLNRRLIQGE
ncbi:MAG: hypothetical protein ABFD49_06595 [Armatimonadota bacterium]|nr:hypothetical protein [bacterium]